MPARADADAVSARLRPGARALLLVLLAAALAGYVVDLGGSSIWDANEAFYVETPREMLERGDYVNPSFNYEPRFNKPVLSYWIVVALYHAFGVSVAVERVAIAGGALIMILAAWWLARTASVHPAAPLLAALGLAANPRFFMFARRIMIDVTLAASMTLVLLFFALSETYPERRRRFLLAMYVAVGLGVLTKGPVAAVLPVLVFSLYLLVHREWRRVREMMIPSGILVALAIAAPWYVALYVESGWTHISGFFIGENLDRFTTAETEGRGLWFYIPVLLTDGLPWSLCLPAVIAAWVTDRRQRSGGPELRIRTLLLLWIAVIVCFFSLSQTKQDLYIFPIVAAVAVLGGDLVARAISSARIEARWLRSTMIATAALLAIGGALALTVIRRSGLTFPLEGASTAAALVLAGAIAVAVPAVRHRPFAAAAALAAVCVAFNWNLVLHVLPSFERYKPVVPLSRTIANEATDGDLVVQFEAPLPSMVFYLRRHVDILYDRQSFLNALRSGVRVFAVLPEGRYEEIRNDIGVETCVLDRRPTADVKLRDIVLRRPPSALVLVSTHCG